MKAIKYLLSFLLTAFLLYNSMYFKKLDEVNAATTSKGFEAAAFARNFYSNQLLPRTDNAVEITQLLNALQTIPDSAFNQYSHALNIGNMRYFLVQGTGKVEKADADQVVVEVGNGSSSKRISIATEFIYGNAIRDASNLVRLNDFSSTADFNAVSEEVNKIVRTTVVPSFRKEVKDGNEVKFAGAIELNRKHPVLDSIEVIPIRLTVSQPE